MVYEIVELKYSFSTCHLRLWMELLCCVEVGTLAAGKECGVQ